MPAPSLHRTYKFPLLPTRGQHGGLRAALDHTRDLYNGALQERIEAWRKAGRSLTRFDQCKGLTELRAGPTWASYAASYAATMQRWPLGKLDLAFKSFHARLKRGDKAGFPRFKGPGRFDSFGFSDKSGWAVDGARLRMKGIGAVRMHMHRALPSRPLSCQIRREGKRWFVLLVCAVASEPLAPTGRAIGLDLGIATFAALSDGRLIANPKFNRRKAHEMRRRRRQLARCKRGSNRRKKVRARLATLQRRTARARRTFHHQVAARLVRDADLIAIEDLTIKGLARSAFARDVNDAAWGQFTALLTEKAAKAVRTLVKVDPRGTSQTCPDCGHVAVKTLTERTHRCASGCVLDRDVAAARVVLHRAVVGPGTHNVERQLLRAA
jgi:putative transposase